MELYENISVCVKCFYISLFLIISTSFLINVASAQPEDEMRILRMYFMEDELVITPTRTPKHLSQVSENISIVTAEDIKNMNAHTLPEVLERVTGMFVTFFGHDFGSDALLEIQGSENRHVLVLLDGIPFNFMTGGNASTNSIPVAIIKRLEIIKGPASSSWGSSLGGLVNVVTKDTSEYPSPSGAVSVSYGDGNSRDYRAEVTGNTGIAEYLLYAGKQDSDGIRDERFFESNTIYVKLNIPVLSNTNISLTAGYSDPYINTGELQSSDLKSTTTNYVNFVTASVSSELSDEIRLEATFYRFKQKFDQDNKVLGTGTYGDAGELFSLNIYDENTTGGSGKFVWKHEKHHAVLGMDISSGELDQTINNGLALQGYGAPAASVSNSKIKKWAFFLNDTITSGNFSITPGIRYDKNDITGSFTSPSLGVTYKAGEKTLLRASVAKGFSIPPLTFTSGGALFTDPNPDLKPEKVWSYQAGVESSAAKYVKAKATIFYHDTDDALVKEMYAAGPPTYNDLYFNKGNIKRKGVELDLETVPFNKTTLKTGLAYVHKKNDFEEDSIEENYSANVAVKYSDGDSFMALFTGYYIWWDLDPSSDHEDAMLWDLNINKNVYSAEKTNGEVFFTAHNIFNGSQYSLSDRKNPKRWIEGGLRLYF